MMVYLLFVVFTSDELAQTKEPVKLEHLAIIICLTGNNIDSSEKSLLCTGPCIIEIYNPSHYQKIYIGFVWQQIISLN